MASLKEIKGRILSVQTTQKTTSAMRMVASAKLHRTQTITQTFLEYVSEMQKIVDSLQLSTPSPSGRAGVGLSVGLLLIPISSSSGLCGAFNSNVAKATLARVKELESQGVKVTLVPIGKKIAHELKKQGLDFNPDYIHLAEGIGNPKVDAYAEVSSFVSYLSSLCSTDECSVEILYHHFKNMGSQVIVTDTLDINRKGNTIEQVPNGSSLSEGRGGASYITEPSPSLLLAELHPKMLNSKVYSILLDSVTSEHAARMMAMQTADDNAKELLQELTLLYNKSRQQAITNELIDIMGGKAAE